MKRKLLALVLALLLCQGLALPALAVVEELASVKVEDVAGYSPDDGIYTVVREGLYGFCRADGTELLPPTYSYAGIFQGGYAVVSPASDSSRFGYVDSNGAPVIGMRYRQAFPFSGERAFAVREDGALVLLDRFGQELAAWPEAWLQPGDSIQLSEGLAVIPVRSGGEEEEETLVYLVVDAGGQEVCTLTDAYVDYLHGYHNGLVAAAEAGEWLEAGEEDASSGLRFQAEPGSWGYRDVSGQLAVDCQYDDALPFSEGLAAVGRQDAEGRMRYGFIDTADIEAVPLEYDDVLPLENGAGAVLREGKWAYVGPSGRLLTGFRFDRVSYFTEDVARVWSGSRVSVINTSGTVLFTIGEGQCLPCSGGVLPVRNEEGLWGVYDKDGTLLVDFGYDRAFHWDGYLWLKRGDLWRVYATEDVLASREEAAAEDETGVGAAAAPVGSFSDVAPEAYYAQAVTWATDSDIVTGTGGGQFSPDRPCTTGEIITFLWRAMGRPEPGAENPFTDVTANHYYYQAALWAHQQGLVEGDVFGASAPCTRSMAVTYLWTLAGRPFSWSLNFEDVPLDAACSQAVSWAVDRGITSGSGGSRFSPEETCSRGQIVTFLYRYLEEA